MGDGALCTFASSDDAYCTARPYPGIARGASLKVRIGFHIGPVIMTDDDVFGATVNLASRLAAMASPGEILMSRSCVDTLHPAYRSNTQRLNSAVMKGSVDAVEIYRTLGDPENITVAVGSFGTPWKRVGILTLTYRGSNPTWTRPPVPCSLAAIPDAVWWCNSDWASRRHATLEIQNSRFTLTDHSTNGTFCLDHSQRLQVLKRQATYLLTIGIISLGVDPTARDQGNLIHYRFGMS